MSEIIPAILEDTLDAVRERMSRVVLLAPMVQIDVCDGLFAPRRSWPYFRNGYDDYFKDILSEKEGMPFWDELDFEADLMVANPEEVVEDWIRAGAARVIPHIEAITDYGRLKERTKGRVELGLAIGIDTPFSALAQYADEISCIQCMGIAKIGYQGQDFDERVLRNIAELRRLYPNVTISVDGGVNIETVPRLIKAGANRLVVGSALFNSPDVKAALAQFKQMV